MLGQMTTMETKQNELDAKIASMLATNMVRLKPLMTLS
jgi:hypothetical protein